MRVVPRNVEFDYINEVLFWLGLAMVLFKYGISIALAYVIIGVCYTMKRERIGNHQKCTWAQALSDPE